MAAQHLRHSGWTLVIHGGAGAFEHDRLSPQRDREMRSALMRALRAGGAILEDNGRALDAVEAAVRVLEDDPVFNAGRGAVFTEAGTIELDAAIMEGRERRAGAVAGIQSARNPVSVARAVMDRSPHVLFAGPGADQFAAEMRLEIVDPAYFQTGERWRQLQDMRARGNGQGVRFDADVKYGTVGAVARDSAGHVSAATSTGGLTGKRIGRVGDSPLIGAGTYADDRAGAVSATGSGEIFIRAGVAHEICARMRFLGESAQRAAGMVQAEVQALGGSGGVIVVGQDGTPAWSFNTRGMCRGRWRSGGEPMVAIFDDE